MQTQTTAAPPTLSFEDTGIAFSSKNNAELYQTYLLFASMNVNWLVSIGTKSVQAAFGLGLPIKGIVKHTLFKQFCGGETIEECEKTIQQLAKFNIGTILDYSVEGMKNEKWFDATMQETIETIEKAAQNHKAIPFSVFKITGLASTPLLEKITSELKGEKVEISAEERAAYERVRNRVDTICKAAHKHKVRIFIDGEETWIQDAIDTICYEMMAKYNKEQCIVYNTFQLYTHDRLGKLKKAVQVAKSSDYYLGAKLVRGAYMERERKRATEMGYPDPIQPNKAACDKDFDEALAFCVENRTKEQEKGVAICAGTHNEQSSYLLANLMKKHNIANNHPDFFFAQLYGMSDNISYNLAKSGYNVAKYVPYGPVKAVMPYLFRRAAENTSIAGQTSREFMLVAKERERRNKK
jgi:proline dehydrogenase